jgi:hypothetical protein
VAWFPEGGDARRLQAQLIAVTDPLDHKVLPDRLASGEALAAFIGHSLVNCVEVESGGRSSGSTPAGTRSSRGIAVVGGDPLLDDRRDLRAPLSSR